MPWRLIGFVLVGALFLCFIGFNLENRCDISFGFVTFSQVPVFLTAFSACVLGMFLSLVLSFRFRRGVRNPSGRGSAKNAGKNGGKAHAVETGVDSPAPDGD